MTRILFIHGASSAGKTTLARAVRAIAPHPFMVLSFDTFRDSGAVRPSDYRWSDAGPRVFAGLHASFAAFADQGLDLIIEHILDRPGWHEDLQIRLAGHDLFFVGLHTPVETLNRRERDRGDRAIGSAARDAASVHNGLRYDLELNGADDPDRNARAILAAWAGRQGRSTFFVPVPAS